MRTLDLFCGGGGSSWGAQAAGAEIVCGVDGWSIAVEAYRKNFPRARTVELMMTEGTRPVELGSLGDIELILASPECTHHSCARGARPRDEASRATAHYVVNFARALEPRWLVIENVVGMKNWPGFHTLVQGFDDLKYHVTPVTLDAQDFGVPQTRRRMFLLCDRKRRLPKLLPPEQDVHLCVDDILDPEDEWEWTPLRREGRAAATLERAERAITALGRDVPFLIVYYGSDANGGWQPLDRPLRTVTTIDRFGLVTWQRGVPMLRMLQVSELQRAMGFAGDYSLEGVSQRRDRIKLLGNGVAPPVMEAIVRHLQAPLDYVATLQREMAFDYA